MKKATAIFTIALVLVFALMVGYVALSPEFEPPMQLGGQEGIAEDNPIWEKNLDDLAAYLEEQGLADAGDYQLLSGGVATDARLYDGMELYWWDLENLAEGTDEYEAYVSACENGWIDLWGSGNIMNVTVHGPFAVCSVSYMGDTDAYLEVFMEYCMEP